MRWKETSGPSEGKTKRLRDQGTQRENIINQVHHKNQYPIKLQGKVWHLASNNLASKIL